MKKYVIKFSQLRRGDIFATSFTGSVEWRKMNVNASNLFNEDMILSFVAEDVIVFVDEWIYNMRCND